MADEGITVNSVNPGWTATGFGGRDESKPPIPGMQSIQDGAKHVVEMATTSSKDTLTFTETAGPLPW